MTGKVIPNKLHLPQPLSLKEKQVLEFLETYIRTQGISPSYQEICNHFGFASFNSVQRYLKQLETKKYLRLPPSNQKRGLTLLRPASSLQNFMQESLDEQTKTLSQVRASDAGRISSLSPSINSRSTSAPPTAPEALTLPLLGRVAAGAPIEAFEYDEFIDVPASLVRNASMTYALRVQGQSMIEDGIFDGDIILVQKQSSASNGEIVVAVVDEEATVKRFFSHEKISIDDESQKKLKKKMIELRPANAKMQPMWFQPQQVQIRGIVVGLIRRFS